MQQKHKFCQNFEVAAVSSAYGPPSEHHDVSLNAAQLMRAMFH